MFIKVGQQGAMTRQIAGAASGTHAHDIENTTLSVANEYLYCFKQIQELSGVVWCLTKASTKRQYIGFKTRFIFGTRKNQ